NEGHSFPSLNRAFICRLLSFLFPKEIFVKLQGVWRRACGCRRRAGGSRRCRRPSARATSTGLPRRPRGEIRALRDCPREGRSARSRHTPPPPPLPPPPHTPPALIPPP